MAVFKPFPVFTTEKYHSSYRYGSSSVLFSVQMTVSVQAKKKTDNQELVFLKRSVEIFQVFTQFK